MKLLKRLTYSLLGILLLLNIWIIGTGKFYLYKAIANTYLKGRSGPEIDEFRIFANREIKTGTKQPWAKGFDYNQKDLNTTYLKEAENYQTTAFLLIQNDSIRYEKYWDGYDDSAISNSFSMAKTIVSILVGCAIQEGKIKSVDQPVYEFLPQYSQGLARRLTVKHLLTMSSGINFDEDYKSPFAYPAKAYYGDDLVDLTLSYTVTKEPGKTLEYLSGNSTILALLLEKATGKTISEYATEKLWIPMGANHKAFWSLDKENGIEKAYCCFNSNARDFARFGKLYLDSGNWKGTQIVPKDFALNSIRPAQLVDESGKPNAKYGYAWWLLNYKGHPVFYMRGILGQYVLVVPDKKLIAVRLGHKRAPNPENADHPKDVYLYLDAALSLAK